MNDSYLRFDWQRRGALVFGFLLMGLSSFGQTFFISILGAELREAYGLSDGGLGTAYAAATIASALSISWVGRWIDRTTVTRYTLATAAVLAMACVGMAVGTGLPVLVGALFLLRLGGQGLMVHTSQTTTARAFASHRGRSLGFIGLGMAFGEALLPLAAVAGIAALGWRAVWGWGALVVLGGTSIALLCRRRASGVPPSGSRPANPSATVPETALWRDPRMLLALPAVLAAPFISTGVFFHQARLAEEKHWSLEWIAGWFVAYALARAVAMVATGPVIDRVGAARTLPWQLLPLGFSMLVLCSSDSRWATLFYLLPVGISAGIARTLLTAVWTELYGPERLAQVRSWVAAASVLASGLSPPLLGWLIDLHVPLWEQAAGCLAYTGVAAALARRLPRLTDVARASRVPSKV